ncbi:MAG TPA: cyclic peptide export ABC transporter [Isosphaeraceae bacterium]|jgi:putative ATP-binding cassette transporter|nr:cyclic peptide export ABC transporter [Isosphaeraceae bacterium]
MALIGFLLRESRKVLALAVAAGLCAGASTVALIALIGAALKGPSTDRLAWAFAGLCLVAATTRVVAQVAVARLAQGSVARLVGRLCDRIAALPLDRFEATEPAALLAVLTEDVAIVAGALAAVPQVGINLPIAVASLAYIGWLSPAILACWLVVALPAVVVFRAIAGRGARSFRRAREGHDDLLAHFRALIDGFRELKQHRGRREAFLGHSLREAAESARSHGVKGMEAFAVAAGWGQVAYFGFLGLVLFALPRLRPLDVEQLGGSALAILYVMTPIDVLLGAIPLLGRARASLRRVESVVPEVDEGPTKLHGLALREALELDGVSFAYRGEGDGEGFAIGPIDLTLRPGEVVVLAGGNGSGKTTLVKLLAGLYEPKAGTFRLDGEIVDAGDREAYRQLFTVVFADGLAFEPRHGLDANGLDARAAAWLERLDLAHKVAIAGGAFTTTDLSQGQRRRLALASALLEDRPIVVLDEWAAHQDSHHRRRFYRELLPALRDVGKALLVISHDDDAAGVADRVVRLDGGRVVEERVPMEEISP